MKRVPASVALLALHQSGYHVTASTLRSWVRRNHISRGPGGYDVHEIEKYIAKREKEEQERRAKVDAGQALCNA